MDSLTEAQKKAFAAANRRLGLDDFHFTDTGVRRRSPDGTVVFSSDPNESHVPPHIIEVNSIAHLNKLIGCQDDAEYDDYPEPNQEATHQAVRRARSKAHLRKLLSDETKGNIRRAAVAYLKGDPKKVEDYEEAINATLFPTRVAAFTGSDLNVANHTTHKITGKDPVALNYGTITVGANAEIKVEVDANITAQAFLQK